jgi:hypothetical protein
LLAEHPEFGSSGESMKETPLAVSYGVVEPLTIALLLIETLLRPMIPLYGNSGSAPNAATRT